MKNYIHLEGTVVYVSKSNGFILKVYDDYIHCRGLRPRINDQLVIDGVLRSYERQIRGQKVTMFVVEII